MSLNELFHLVARHFLVGRSSWNRHMLMHVSVSKKCRAIAAHPAAETGRSTSKLAYGLKSFAEARQLEKKWTRHMHSALVGNKAQS
jgi:hypothetical protein